MTFEIDVGALQKDVSLYEIIPVLKECVRGKITCGQ